MVTIRHSKLPTNALDQGSARIKGEWVCLATGKHYASAIYVWVSYYPSSVWALAVPIRNRKWLGLEECPMLDGANIAYSCQGADFPLSPPPSPTPLYHHVTPLLSFLLMFLRRNKKNLNVLSCCQIHSIWSSLEKRRKSFLFWGLTPCCRGKLKTESQDRDIASLHTS